MRAHATASRAWAIGLIGAKAPHVLLLLVGLIFRGIAFEFRSRAVRMRWLLDWGFFFGSTVVAFVQGAAADALMRGPPVGADGQFAGGSLDSLHPFAILAGIWLVFGYALLGAGWIVLKSEDALRNWARGRIPWPATALAAFVVLGLASAVAHQPPGSSLRQELEWRHAGALVRHLAGEIGRSRKPIFFRHAVGTSAAASSFSQ
jgi:cytochrome bd-type quinol oxidase subunit 2